MKRNIKILIGIFILINSASSVYSQLSIDSLSMQTVIYRALNNYPTVQQAEEAVKTAQINKKMIES